MAENHHELISQLTQYRLKNRLTQQQLAQKLGVSRMSLSRWLKGHCLPRPIPMFHIKELLKNSHVICDN